MDKNNKDNKIKANDELKIDFTKGSDDTTPLAVKKTSTVSLNSFLILRVCREGLLPGW